MVLITMNGVTKKPLTRWYVQVLVSQDGYGDYLESIWCDSADEARRLAHECYRLLHSSDHCRCSYHDCDRCVDKDVGKETIREKETHDETD